VPEIGKAATLVMLQTSAPAREPIAWRHAPSQPLMRSPLSQFQTPTAPRRNRRFFRVGLPFRSPCRADHSAFRVVLLYPGPSNTPEILTGPVHLEITRNRIHKPLIALNYLPRGPVPRPYGPPLRAYSSAAAAASSAGLLLARALSSLLETESSAALVRLLVFCNSAFASSFLPMA
jgi:hypothetical protein